MYVIIAKKTKIGGFTSIFIFTFSNWGFMIQFDEQVWNPYNPCTSADGKWNLGIRSLGFPEKNQQKPGFFR